MSDLERKFGEPIPKPLYQELQQYPHILEKPTDRILRLVSPELVEQALNYGHYRSMLFPHRGRQSIPEKWLPGGKYSINASLFRGSSLAPDSSIILRLSPSYRETQDPEIIRLGYVPSGDRWLLEELDIQHAFVMDQTDFGTNVYPTYRRTSLDFKDKVFAFEWRQYRGPLTTEHGTNMSTLWYVEKIRPDHEDKRFLEMRIMDEGNPEESYGIGYHVGQRTNSILYSPASDMNAAMLLGYNMFISDDGSVQKPNPDVEYLEEKVIARTGLSAMELKDGEAVIKKAEETITSFFGPKTTVQELTEFVLNNYSGLTALDR